MTIVYCAKCHTSRDSILTKRETNVCGECGSREFHWYPPMDEEAPGNTALFGVADNE